MILVASPSAIAVLPTPGSPIRIALFFFLRQSISIVLSISLFLPIKQSIASILALLLRLVQYFQARFHAGYLYVLPLSVFEKFL